MSQLEHGATPNTPHQFTDEEIARRERALASIKVRGASADTQPETESTLSTAADTRPSRRRGRVVVGSLVAAGLVAGAGVAYNLLGSDSGNDTESTGNKDKESSAVGFSLDAKDYDGNPEKLAIDMFSNINDWQNSGYSAEVAQDPAQFTDTTPAEYAAGIAGKLDQKFIDQALVSDWQSNSNLVEFVAHYSDIHAKNLAVAISTLPGEDGGRAENTEQYERTIEISNVDVVSTDGDTVTISADWQGDDNREKNVAAEFVTDVDDSGTLEATFVVEGGTERLADIDFTTTS